MTPKLWKTYLHDASRFDADRHPSYAAAYHRVKEHAMNKAIGALSAEYATIYVDDRDGEGWKPVETVHFPKFEQTVTT